MIDNSVVIRHNTKERLEKSNCPKCGEDNWTWRTDYCREENDLCENIKCEHGYPGCMVSGYLCENCNYFEKK